MEAASILLTCHNPGNEACRHIYMGPCHNPGNEAFRHRTGLSRRTRWRPPPSSSSLATTRAMKPRHRYGSLPQPGHRTGLSRRTSWRPPPSSSSLATTRAMKPRDTDMGPCHNPVNVTYRHRYGWVFATTRTKTNGYFPKPKQI